MILYVTSGYSLRDYISQNGWSRAFRLLFRNPALVWQMGGSGFMRLLLRSRRIHVLIESKGFVLDRQFCSDVITTGPTVMTRPDLQGYIVIGRPSAAVPSRPVPRSDNVFKVTLGFLSLYVTRGKRRLFMKSDCVTVAKWYLTRAGVDVPDAIWNPDGLIQYLERLGYMFVPTGDNMGSPGIRSMPAQGPLKALQENPALFKKFPTAATNPILKTGDAVGAPKIPKQETPKIAAPPPVPAPSAAMLLSPMASPASRGGESGLSMYASRTSSRGKRALTIRRA